jgi:aspartyl/asparaginyl-tRNA synthetase
MERTLIGNLRQATGQKVTIQGWLQVLRDQKKMQFLILRDRTGLAQVAFWKPNDPIWPIRFQTWEPKAR